MVGTAHPTSREAISVTKKIILLVLLVASAAIAAEAFSQGTPGSSASDKSGPSAEKKPADVSPAPSRNVPPAIFSPSKSDVPAPSKDKKDKDTSPRRTFPTSSVSPTSSAAAAANRNELVIPGALVTLKDDNKLPASEAGMLIDVPVEEGQSVEKDEIVAQIDSRSTLAKQNIAKAEWEAAKAQAANNAEIEVAESAIEVSKA